MRFFDLDRLDIASLMQGRLVFILDGLRVKQSFWSLDDYLASV